ncbi:MAG TPA: hypothetical protein PKD64_16485 [Pirellulaceae bacterium]|nr:hypothetical protein [Pirellulaceae bacterium]HMO93788.1 hypothetical protein [Pirellulaceae bacterium]HMP70618.1 hypothetical protein [Pirellulaceae bacterium]
MSVDQALLESANHFGQVTFRWYRWQPATLSLGYFQPYRDRETHRPSITCDCVRRASGGGAILHDREWTYSLTLPARDRLATAHEVLVDLIHQAVIDALSRFNIAAQFFADYQAEQEPTQKEQNAPQPFLCFLRRSKNDLVIGDHKVLGSAQRRVDGALLQHGSILLQRSAFAPELPGILDLNRQPEATPDERALFDQFNQSIADKLELTFEQTSLTESERQLAQTIEHARFANQKWTQKR